MDKELAQRELKEYVKQAWHVVEPANEYISGWHIDVICDHLEAVSRGDIKRLIINEPPRHLKSLCVSVFWPTWEWISNPSCRWLFASYSERISFRDSLKCRRIIQSPWYQNNWGHIYQLTGDQNAKGRYDTTKTGYRIATTVGGVGTGEGGDRIVCDDPHSVLETLSDVKREAAITWWYHVMPTRGDTKKSTKVIIMQRCHERDLTGHILAKELEYDHLCLPAEYEGMNRCRTFLGFTDPRKEVGELLHPERFDKSDIETLKAGMIPYTIAGQLQQRPVPLKGGCIKWESFRRFDSNKIDPFKTPQAFKVQFWDTAQKKGVTNSPWVCGTWVCGPDLPGWFLIDLYREWMTYPEGKKAAINQFLKHTPIAVVIEDKSTGQSLIQELPLEPGPHIPVLPFLPELDKEKRLEIESTSIEAGLVWIPETAHWMTDFELEIRNFPNSVTKDQADMLSMALRWFRERNIHSTSIVEVFGESSINDYIEDVGIETKRDKRYFENERAGGGDW